ncbi:TolB family protein [Candidatus Omnitrophota bacterium]
MKPFFLSILIFCLFPIFVIADSEISEVGIKQVFVEKGNIYYLPEGKEAIQLTDSGKDETPVLSPDGKIVAFIRKSAKEAYLAVGAPEDYPPEGLFADQIWIVNIDGSGEKMLVENKHPKDIQITPDVPRDDWVSYGLERTIAHIDSLQFSPDSKRLYFITSAWVTSGAVHCVDVDGSNERFLMAGNSLEIIGEGRYKGYLIVRQHRYFLAGGSYDWLWLFTPDGEKEGPLGIDLDHQQRDFLYSD